MTVPSICAVVLLGPGSAKIVGDAVRSCIDHVDSVIAIEAGGGRDAVGAVLQVTDGRRPTAVRWLDWQGDYGAARQFSLEAAGSLNADYALFLDPDQRYALDDPKAALADFPGLTAWSVPTEAGHLHQVLAKARAGLRWVGITCEELRGPDGKPPRAGVLPGCMRELPKTTEQLRARAERGLPAMGEMIRREPDVIRWQRHRAECLVELGRKNDATDAFFQAWTSAKTPADTAWTGFRYASLLAERGQWLTAWDLVGQHIVRFPEWLPELSYLACFLSAKLQRPGDAAHWASICLHAPKHLARPGPRATGARAYCADYLKRYNEAMTEQIKAEA